MSMYPKNMLFTSESVTEGHPEMAQCIPLGFQSYKWDEQ